MNLVDNQVFTLYEDSSPYMLMASIIAIGLANQSPSGIFYIFFIAFLILIRMVVYQMVNFKYSNDTGAGVKSISMFIGSFTFVYLILPMLINKSVNFWITCGLILYVVSDYFLRYYTGHTSTPVDLFLNAIVGSASAIGSVFFMMGFGLDQYLMFNETSSNKVMCNVPKKQTFKCSVYKNGELIGSA